MKLKENFVFQKIADDYIVVPVGEEADKIHGIIKLNETGAILWEKLSKETCTRDDLVELLLSEYNTSKTKLLLDIDIFIEQLIKLGCIEQ